MGIRETQDLFKYFDKERMSRLELQQLLSMTVDMVRDQVNAGRINGCKILTPVGLEELVKLIQDDSHKLPIIYPDAKESIIEEVSDDSVHINNYGPTPNIHIISKTMNFSGNIMTKQSTIEYLEDGHQIELKPSPLLPDSESEWLLKLRTPNPSNPKELSSDVVLEIVTKGAKSMGG